MGKLLFLKGKSKLHAILCLSEQKPFRKMNKSYNPEAVMISYSIEVLSTRVVTGASTLQNL